MSDTARFLAWDANQCTINAHSSTVLSQKCYLRAGPRRPGAAGIACHDLRPAGPRAPPRCRSARSAVAVGHQARGERPDELQAPSSATDNKIRPFSHKWHSTAPVSSIRLFDAATRLGSSQRICWDRKGASPRSLAPRRQKRRLDTGLARLASLRSSFSRSSTFLERPSQIGHQVVNT
jgi:hypothetical protein